jgi:RNA polymerase sigma-70 factor (ECF subfamily)
VTTVADRPAAPAQRRHHGPDPDPALAWELVQRAQVGDQDAAADIYRRYRDTVYFFLHYRIRGTDRALVEDLTADTFVRALARIDRFTFQGLDFGAWLVTIARNLLADHYKSGRYRLEVTTGDVLNADKPDRRPEGSPDAMVVDHLRNRQLWTAVLYLNPDQRQCIELRFLHGLNVAETAEAMGRQEGAVKALQYRAVRTLRRTLGEDFLAVTG